MAQARKSNTVSILTRVAEAADDATNSVESRLNGSPSLAATKKRRKKTTRRRGTKATAKKSSSKRARKATTRVSALLESWRPSADGSKKSWKELVEDLALIADQWKHKIEDLRETREDRWSKIETLVEREVARNVEQGLKLVQRAQKIAIQQVKRSGFKKTARWLEQHTKTKPSKTAAR